MKALFSTAILLITILTSTITFCQEVSNAQINIKKAILDTDIRDGQNRSFLDIVINIPNVDDELKSVKVSFFSTSDVYNKNSVTAEKLNNMIYWANYGSKKLIKNLYTYQPKKIDIFYDDKKNVWVLMLDYTAQNDYGATKNGTSISTYKSDTTYIATI